MTSGEAGYLYMMYPSGGNPLKHLLGDLTFHAMTVIKVHLNPQIGSIDGLDQGMSLGLVGQKIVGHVNGIDGFYDQSKMVNGGLTTGPGQILEKSVTQTLRGVVLPHEPCHDMQTGTMGGKSIRQSHFKETLAKLCLSFFMNGQPTFALSPISGRSVEQHQIQCLIRESTTKFLCRQFLVREQALNGAETICGRLSGTIGKGDFGIEPTQIGGKVGHGF